MPREQPLLHLPPSHQAWDELAAQLPELFRSLTLRAVARPHARSSTPARQTCRIAYLLRASAILSIFAHAYYYVEPDPAGALPEFDPATVGRNQPAPAAARRRTSHSSI